MTDLGVILSVIGGAGTISVIGGGLAALYSRAVLTDTAIKIAVIEARLSDLRSDLKGNYDYCHSNYPLSTSRDVAILDS